ncbi:MAG: gentisate 1,2-dioxygenase [Rhodocyclaceae bacterium]|nr:MAG: gentisate 1,2-dioxygenase [Rhodocyclaceae bacterium]
MLPTSTLENSADRNRFYNTIDEGNCAPLWSVLHDLVSATPKTPCLPYIWHWEKVWPWIQEAGRMITTEKAERRVLILENPGLRGLSAITHSLYAGLQLILPGEVARAHRHSQSALRFVLQGKGAYTTVGGERVTMNVGDFIITPSWEFHDHGNLSEEPVVWLDGLDVPIVEMFDAQFMEYNESLQQEVTRVEGESLAMFGNTMRPVEYSSHSHTSPLFWYPYERTRAALETLKLTREPHDAWGHKLEYLNPLNGQAAMPTIGTFMQMLPQGFRGRPYRATDSTVYAVIEGRGSCVINDERLPFSPRDVFVCPSWMSYSLEADQDTVLFSFSDRPVQKSLDLWREEIL